MLSDSLRAHLLLRCRHVLPDSESSKKNSDISPFLDAVLQEKVYANADAQAKLFMEYVQSSQDQDQDQADFDFEGDRQYDGGSFDSEFAGNARSSPV